MRKARASVLVSLFFASVVFLSFSARADEPSAPAREPQAARKATKPSENPPPIETWHVVGAGVGTLYGFGLGHPFQGRYLEKGWIFTTSQVAGLGLMLAGGFMGDCFQNGRTVECSDHGKLALGAAVFVGSRLWEIFDLWTHLRAPVNHQALILVGPQNLSLAWQF